MGKFQTWKIPKYRKIPRYFDRGRIGIGIGISVKYRYRKNTDFLKIVRYRIRYRYFGKNTAVLPKNTAVIRYRDQH